jgi:hypothetical protein
MPDRPNPTHPSSPQRNPLGLGPRDRESSNTGSTADTSYNAYGSDPYTTGEPAREPAAPEAAASTRADGDTTASDEP